MQALLYRIYFQVKSTAGDKYAYASSGTSSNADTPTLDVSIIDDDSASVNFTAASKVNVSILTNNTELTGPEGVLNQYLISDLDSYLKVLF